MEVETPTASPFASSLLFDYVATYMYEGDTPNAERRAAALALDRDLLRELLGQEELRELIDPGALEQVEADLQHPPSARAPTASTRCTTCCAGSATSRSRRCRQRTLGRTRAEEWLGQLARERRAMRLRLDGELRWAAAEDAGLLRDALGAVPPAACPRRSWPTSPTRWSGSCAAGRARTARSRRASCASATASTSRRCWPAWSAPASWCAASCARAAREREWCDPEVLRRLRRASLAALRKEIEPADQRALARFMPAWQGVDRHPPAGAGIDRLREVLVPLQGLALPVDVWEKDVLPRRTGAYSPGWLDQLCAAGEVVWIGAGALGRRSGRWRCTSARTSRCSARRPAGSRRPPSPPTRRSASGCASGAAFFTDLLVDVQGITTEELQEALWDLVWAGEVTNDAFAPLRSPKLSAPWSQQARADRRRSFSARRRGPSRRSRAAGR